MATISEDVPKKLAIVTPIAKRAVSKKIVIKNPVIKTPDLITSHPGIQTIRPDKAAHSLNLLLNSQIDILSRYANQSNLLRVNLANGSDYVVPAVEVLNAAVGRIESQLEVGFVESHFSVSLGSSSAFKIYKADSTGRGKSFYNTKTARLIEVSYEPNVRLTFQPTSYFDYVKTNMAMDFEDRVAGNLRDEIHGAGVLEDLSRSRLANHTGISGLVFSRDEQMIVQRRGPKVFTYPNQLSPGFSGTLTSGDIAHLFKKGETTSTIAAVDVLREMEEELGVGPDLITDRCFMGLSRELMRGGLPELFYAVDVNMTAREILNCFARDREGETFAFPLPNSRARLNPLDAARLCSRFDMLIADIERAGARRASLPLISNLAFWVNQYDAPKVGGKGWGNILK